MNQKGNKNEGFKLRRKSSPKLSRWQIAADLKLIQPFGVLPLGRRHRDLESERSEGIAGTSRGDDPAARGQSAMMDGHSDTQERIRTASTF